MANRIFCPQNQIQFSENKEHANWLERTLLLAVLGPEDQESNQIPVEMKSLGFRETIAFFSADKSNVMQSTTSIL